jgi:hypothetical protein
MSETNTAALAPHGTPERWQADCDCEECCDAIQTMVGQSALPGNSSLVLRYMLDFRVGGCELYVVPAMISDEGWISQPTVRRHIDKLVEFGALSKIADIKRQPGRSGVYLLHIEKLKMRSELRLFREHGRLAETEGFTNITAWRMMLLKEHEAAGGDLCIKCGNFPVSDGGSCTHCFVSKFEPRENVRCPVCQETKIPKVFFEPKMRNELGRVEKARMELFQHLKAANQTHPHRGLTLVKI